MDNYIEKAFEDAFTSFTGQAQAAWRVAYMQAIRSRQARVGPEFLLYGILEQPNVATAIVRGLGIEPEKVQKQVSDTFEMGNVSPGNSLPDPQAHQIIQYASELAREMKSTRITTGHILFAILCVSDTAAARVLRDFGMNAGSVKSKLETHQSGFDET